MVEEGENEAGELAGQRNLLLKGQVSSQKLALSLGVQNQQRTKMYAFAKFADFGNARLQGKIEQALKANLERIADMKNNMARLESTNDELAKQNDEFRRGAMDGINMVRHVEALTADRDKLSVDLADKALTIRKLLEDNQYLQNKLTSAQGQAATLIDEAKKQMGTIERSDQGLQHVPARETSPTLVVGSRENDPH